VVLEQVDQIVGARADLDQVDGVPRPAERDRRLVEEQLDVERPVRLAVTALLELLDEPYDRGVTLGERGLVGKGSEGGGSVGERG
jgi:hypothetical protein